MEFILILENNHKEDEVFLHYCQWTGNEEELTKLFDAFEKADYEELLGGDYSSFWFSDVKLSESAVDEHIRIKSFGGFDHMFQKHTGTFRCPEFSDDSYEAAKEIDEHFYACRIERYFK